MYRLKVWYVAARRFLYSTVSLIGRIIHPPKETVAVLKQKELMKSKKKKSKEKRHAGRSAERERPFESVYLHYFIKFAELFFLENTYVYMYVDNIVLTNFSFPLRPTMYMKTNVITAIKKI